MASWGSATERGATGAAGGGGAGGKFVGTEWGDEGSNGNVEGKRKSALIGSEKGKGKRKGKSISPGLGWTGTGAGGEAAKKKRRSSGEEEEEEERKQRTPPNMVRSNEQCRG